MNRLFKLSFVVLLLLEAESSAAAVTGPTPVFNPVVANEDNATDVATVVAMPNEDNPTADGNGTGVTDDDTNSDANRTSVKAIDVDDVVPFINIESISTDACDLTNDVVQDCTITVASSTVDISKDTIMVGVNIECQTSSDNCFYLNSGYKLSIFNSIITGSKNGRFIQMASSTTLGIYKTQASNFGTSSLAGGFIYSKDAHYDIEIGDSVLSNNLANNGGAMLLSGSPGGQLRIESSSFLTNQAVSQGGAIYAGGNSDRALATWFITGSTFKGNYVTGTHGGAIMAQYITATFVDTQFIENTAYIYGGAMYYYYSSFTFQCCVFASNSAGLSSSYNGDGGAMYTHGSSSTATRGYTTLIKTLFINNKDDDIYFANTYVTYTRDLYTTAVSLTGSTPDTFVPIAPWSTENVDCTN